MSMMDTSALMSAPQDGSFMPKGCLTTKRNYGFFSRQGSFFIQLRFLQVVLV